MTTITIELPDDILEAVQIEAEARGTSAKERIERIIEMSHRHRVSHTRAEMLAERERIERGEVPGNGIPLGDLLPTGKGQ